MIPLNKDIKASIDSFIPNCHKSNCTGIWGCYHLTTPPPKEPEGKERTFINVYREAKTKGILSCPNFKAANIDIILDKMF